MEGDYAVVTLAWQFGASANWNRWIKETVHSFRERPLLADQRLFGRSSSGASWKLEKLAQTKINIPQTSKYHIVFKIDYPLFGLNWSVLGADSPH
jgi:hypothetical protein